MTLINSSIVLIIGTGRKLAATYTANKLAVFLYRLDGVKSDVVRMVVVVGTEATTGDAQFGNFTRQNDLNNVVKLDVFGFKIICPDCGRILVPGSTVLPAKLVNPRILFFPRRVWIAPARPTIIKRIGMRAKKPSAPSSRFRTASDGLSGLT